MSDAQAFVAVNTRALLGRHSDGSTCGAFASVIDSEHVHEPITDIKGIVNKEPEVKLDAARLSFLAILSTVQLLQQLPPLANDRKYDVLIHSEVEGCWAALFLCQRQGTAGLNEQHGPNGDLVRDIVDELQHFKQGTIRFTYRREDNKRATALALAELHAAGATVTSSLKSLADIEREIAPRTIMDFMTTSTSLRVRSSR